MSCTLEFFNENFDDVFKDTDNVDLTKHPRAKRILEVAESVNTTARLEGFNADIFDINDSRTKVTINRQASENYDSYIRDFLRPNMNMIEMDVKTDMKEYYRKLGLLDNREAFQDPEIDVFKSDTDEILFNPIDFQNFEFSQDPSVASVESSVLEWIRMREDLIKQIDKEINRTRRGRDAGIIRSNLNINKLALESQVEEMKKNLSEGAYSNMVSEIEALNTILSHVDSTKSPEYILRLFNGNFFNKRLEMIESVFKELDQNHQHIYGIIHIGMSPIKVAELNAKVENLRNRYNRKVDILVYSIVVNNEYFQHLKSSMPEDNESFAKALDKVREIISDPDVLESGGGMIEGLAANLGREFLGASGVNNILANTLKMARTRAERFEKGIHNTAKRTLKIIYPKLLAIKSPVGGKSARLLDHIWELDEFGVRTNRIITHGSFLRSFNIREARKFQDAYFAEEAYTLSSLEAYNSWMNRLYNDFEFFDLANIPELRDEFGHLPEFEGVFEDGDSSGEYIAEYGELAYRLEIEKARQNILKYLAEPHISNSEKYHNNPVRFTSKMREYREYNIKNFEEGIRNPEPFDWTDVERGGLFNPKFVRYSPPSYETRDSRLDRLSQEFKKAGLEKEFIDFYINLLSMQNYINEAKRAEGIEVDDREIGEIEDWANREIIAEMNLFQRYVTLPIRQTWKNIVSTYKQGRYEDEGNIKKKVTDADKSLQTHFSDSQLGSKRKYRELLNTLPMDRLLDMAEKAGLSQPDNFQELITEDPNLAKSLIVGSLVRHKFNRQSSMDIYRRIMTELQIAESYNSRKSVEAIADMFIYFSDLKNLEKTSDYLRVWRDRNIYELGRLQGRWLSGVDRIKLNKSPLVGKTYTEAEKTLKNWIKSERKNLTGDYNFKLGSDTYQKLSDNQYTVTDKKGRVRFISEAEMKDAYEQYLINKINTLGRDRILGRVITGIAWNMNRYYLAVNPTAGIKNFLQGQDQNRERAASGLYSYDMDNLYRARRLMSVFTPTETAAIFFGDKHKDSVRKAVSYLTLKPRKLKELEVIKHLAESLGILSNVVQDLSGETSGSVLTDAGTKLSSFATQFAIDIPEFMNQMVLLPAMMNNEKFMISDIYGNRRLLYDPNHEHPFPFDLDTMKLLPQYRTPENIANWEQFKPAANGYALHEVLLEQFQENRNVTQGNYDLGDNIKISSTSVGHSVTSFMKWSYENMNSYWGYTDVDMTFGHTEMKGKALTMLDRPILAATYAIMGTLSSPLELINAMEILRSGDPKGALERLGKQVGSHFVLIGMLATSVRNMWVDMKARQKEDLSLFASLRKNLGRIITKEAAKEAAGFVAETALRTIDTSIRSSTVVFGDFDIKLMSQERMDKLLGLTEEAYARKNLSLRDRKQLSSMAQNLANRVNTTRFYGVMLYATQALLKYLLSLVSGDDEEKNEVYREQIFDFYELHARYLINNMHDVVDDSRQWTSPSAIVDLYSSFVFYQHTMRMQEKYFEGSKGFAEGEEDFVDLLYSNARYGIAPAIGFPSPIMKAIEPGQMGSPFRSRGIYRPGGLGEFEKMLIFAMRSPEEKSEKAVAEMRNQLRAPVHTEIGKQIDNLAKMWDVPLTKKKRRDIIQAKTRQFWKDQGVHKTKDNTYESILNETDWRAVKENIKNIRIEDLETSQPKKRRVPAPSSDSSGPVVW